MSACMRSCGCVRMHTERGDEATRSSRQYALSIFDSHQHVHHHQPFITNPNRERCHLRCMVPFLSHTDPHPLSGGRGHLPFPTDTHRSVWIRIRTALVLYVVCCWTGERALWTKQSTEVMTRVVEEAASNRRTGTRINNRGRRERWGPWRSAGPGGDGAAAGGCWGCVGYDYD